MKTMLKSIVRLSILIKLYGMLAASNVLVVRIIHQEVESGVLIRAFVLALLRDIETSA